MGKVTRHETASLNGRWGTSRSSYSVAVSARRRRAWIEGEARLSRHLGSGPFVILPTGLR